MNIVFLIGNGFDLNLGLRTRFTDFYDYYGKMRADDKRQHIQTFLDKIKSSGEDWSDFETSFGKYAQYFSRENYEDYLEVWADVLLLLTKYINLQQKNAIPADLRPNFDTCRCLMFPEKFLARGARSPFEKLRAHTGAIANIDVINFNYTSTFEKLYDWHGAAETLSDGLNHATLNSVTHIHGTTRELMILGVDNPAQIAETGNISEIARVRNRLIKPVANKNSQTLRDEDCAKLIANANIICIFGMSLGVTDQTWWHLVGERLQSPDAMAIIFSRNKDIPANLGYLSIELQEAKISEFLNVANIAANQAPELTHKIGVAFNSGMFSGFTNITSYRTF